jgi:hypothetical protein
VLGRAVFLLYANPHQPRILFPQKAEEIPDQMISVTSIGDLFLNGGAGLGACGTDSTDNGTKQRKTDNGQPQSTFGIKITLTESGHLLFSLSVGHIEVLIS